MADEQATEAVEPQAPDQPADEGLHNMSEQDRLIMAVETMTAENEKVEAAQPQEEPEPAHPSSEVDDILAAAAQERATIRNEMDAIKREREEMASERQKMEELIGRARTDPDGFMKEHAGQDWYMDATQRFLNKGEPGADEIKRREASEMAEMRKELAEMRAWREAQPYEQQAKDYLSELNVKLADPQYAIIAKDPVAVQELHRFVGGYAEKNGSFLPVDDALGKVKQAQIERLQKLRSDVTDWPDLFGEQPQGSQPPQQTAKPPAGTISNSQPARGAPPTANEEDVFDEEDRIRRAVAALTDGESGGP